MKARGATMKNRAVFVSAAALSLAAWFVPAARAAVPVREALFPLSQVRLAGGPLQWQQEQNRKYLLRLDPDRLLSRFRLEAGLGGRLLLSSRAPAGSKKEGCCH